MDDQDIRNYQLAGELGKRADVEMQLTREAIDGLKEQALKVIMTSKPEDQLNIQRAIVVYQLADAVFDLLGKAVANGKAAEDLLRALDERVAQ